MTHHFNPSGIWSPRERGFSMGLVPDDGRLLYFTGQVAWNEREEIVGLGDVRLQTRQCFRNIEAVLAAVGGRLEDLVSVTTYYLEPSHLSIIQQVRSEFLSSDRAPVSTSVQVAGLGHPDFLVELTPIAVVPSERFLAPS